MDRASMTVRMVGEKLAREARGTAGADAAGKTDRLKAAVQECRTAAAQIQQEAKSKAGASADDLNTLIAEVSSDIEGIIDAGVSSDLIEKAQEQLEEQCRTAIQDAVEPLFGGTEEEIADWQKKAVDAAMPAIMGAAAPVIQDMAANTMQHCLTAVVKAIEFRENMGERRKARAESLDRIDREDVKFCRALDEIQRALLPKQIRG